MSGRNLKFRFTFVNGNFVAQEFMTLDELLDCEFAQEHMESTINADNGISLLEDFPEYKMFKDEYTGLKDRNGVDIYESDVINVNVGSVENEKGQVIFKEGRYLIKWIDESMNDELYDFNEESEVIGNIYENKDLLNDT